MRRLMKMLQLWPGLIIPAPVWRLRGCSTGSGVKGHPVRKPANPLVLPCLSSALPQHRRSREPQEPSCQHLRSSEPCSLCHGERQSKAASYGLRLVGIASY